MDAAAIGAAIESALEAAAVAGVSGKDVTPFLLAKVKELTGGESLEANIALVRDLCEVMTDGSLCALGGLVALPVLSALDHFGEDFVKAPASAAAE